MSRPLGPACAFVAAALALAGPALLPAPAQAGESFYFGYSSGHRHYPRHHYHRPYRGPAFGYSYYYAPPPRVVYAYPPYPPPAVVYVPVPQAPRVAAAPATPVYQRPDGQYCREYQASTTIDGEPRPTYGTACLQPDGSWRLMN